MFWPLNDPLNVNKALSLWSLLFALVVVVLLLLLVLLVLVLVVLAAATDASSSGDAARDVVHLLRLLLLLLLVPRPVEVLVPVPRCITGGPSAAAAEGTRKLRRFTDGTHMPTQNNSTVRNRTGAIAISKLVTA